MDQDLILANAGKQTGPVGRLGSMLKSGGSWMAAMVNEIPSVPQEKSMPKKERYSQYIWPIRIW